MSPSRDRAAREVVIRDAAIEVVAAAGLRGLTHRAVDEQAGLPAGSTSYYHRTRDALLNALIERLAQRSSSEPPALADPPTVDELAELVADQLYAMTTTGRSATLARYELSLEATRRPELRRSLEEAGAAYRGSAADLLAALGSTDPERHGRRFVSWCDGLVYDALVGAGTSHPPTRAELADGVRAMLRGLLNDR